MIPKSSNNLKNFLVNISGYPTKEIRENRRAQEFYAQLYDHNKYNSRNDIYRRENLNNTKFPFFLIIFSVLFVTIVAVLSSGGYFLEAIAFSGFGSIFLNILALFWKPSRKAIGLLNMISGIFMMITIIGIPFGIFIFFIGAVIFFI